MFDGLVQEVFDEIVCIQRNQRSNHLPNVASDETEDFRQRKSVERRCDWDGVSAHVLEDDEVANVDVGHWNVDDELVQSVTCRSPNCAGERLLGVSRLLKDDWLHDLMIVEQAVERPINAVVDVVHHVFNIVRLHIVDVLLRLNVCDECEGRSDVKSSGLSDDTNVLVWEISLKTLVDEQRDIVDGLIIVSGEASANVQQSHGESQGFSFVEELLAKADGLEVDRKILTARSDMEADSDDVQVQAASNFKELRSFCRWVAAKLLAQWTLCSFGFTSNAEHQAESRKNKCS